MITPPLYQIFITIAGSTFVSPCQFSYFNIFMDFLIYNFFTIYTSVLSAWIHAMYMPGIPRGQKRASDSLEMKLPVTYGFQQPGLYKISALKHRPVTSALSFLFFTSSSL